MATGLYASGSVQGQTVIREPSSSPSALPAMLELLARASPYGPLSMAELLISHAPRLRRGTSIVAIAANFSEPALVALHAVGRRLPVTTVWVETDHGRPPVGELAQTSRKVTYDDGWKQREFVDLLL